jgi:hypothetical protein
MIAYVKKKHNVYSWQMGNGFFNTKNQAIGGTTGLNKKPLCTEEENKEKSLESRGKAKVNEKSNGVSSNTS